MNAPCQQAAADDVVLGGVSDGDALQRYLGAAAAEPAEPGFLSNRLDVGRQAIGCFQTLKHWGLGVYHGLRKTNLQHYLDEFVFRFNRRRTRHAAFNTFLGIGARTAPAPYHVLIRKTA